MKKKIIFLDGDGTLWYPRATKRMRKPHWIYEDPQTKDAYLEHMELVSRTDETLEFLWKKGAYLVVISAHPNPSGDGLKELKNKLEHFNLLHMIHSYYVSDGNDPEGKALIMKTVVQDLGLTSQDAIMIGDSYFYDYLAAQSVGIDALFIKNEIARMPEGTPTNLRTIHEVHELLYNPILL